MNSQCLCRQLARLEPFSPNWPIEGMAFVASRPRLAPPPSEIAWQGIQRTGEIKHPPRRKTGWAGPLQEIPLAKRVSIAGLLGALKQRTMWGDACSCSRILKVATRHPPIIKSVRGNKIAPMFPVCSPRTRMIAPQDRSVRRLPLFLAHPNWEQAQCVLSVVSRWRG